MQIEDVRRPALSDAARSARESILRTPVEQ
jgi:hypothetical protein